MKVWELFGGVGTTFKEKNSSVSFKESPPASLMVIEMVRDYIELVLKI